MRSCEQSTFETLDGSSIFYRYWPAMSDRDDRAIVLLHRGHEHSGRLQHLVDELNLPDFHVFAWDARGHGLSPGRRGYAPSVAALVKDLDTFIRNVILPQGVRMENVAVIGQSVGSVIAVAWAHDYAPKIRCMVLAAPAFEVKLYAPFARTALTTLHKLFGDFTIRSYVKANFLTHDSERITTFQSDPLITRAISVKLLLDLHATSKRVVKDSAAIQVPTQLLTSGSDWVVRRKPQLAFFERLSSTYKEKHAFEGFYHDTLGEKGRQIVIEKARRFILAAFGRPLEVLNLLGADKNSASKEEFDRLSRPLRALSSRAIYYTAMKTATKTVGRLSNGIRLGLKTGFDSGATLDYVYRNQAAGIGPLGKLVDSLYLKSIGWRGIRVRKQHLERLLAVAMAKLETSGRLVNIVDIAAGHGRYILDAVQPHAKSVGRILLRDYSESNVRQASLLLTACGLNRLAQFERGDAFDRAALAAIRPRATIIIVSGLYELFPDNEPVQISLAGVAEATEPGGYLIYTGQPWHPQLELIARTLPSHRDHKPWIMRRRSQAELDQLVETAGFQKLDQLTDDWGMFTVSLAQRLER